IKDQGAVTIAQDQESSVVHGMPGEAIRLEAATYVLPPNRIAAALVNLTNKRGAHEEQ
ncbi:MAG: chemotaxis response regulator protein-glutamate methylesterase, partial [Acidobacteria bacterium]|nr:chemotaxis response regulator protein-glutamate methylesterase [Acidobacteriota bacterium]